MIAVLRQRVVSGENGSVKGIPLALAERLAVAEDVVVAGCRLDGEAGGFEPADELADVLPHVRVWGRVTLAAGARAAVGAVERVEDSHVSCRRARSRTAGRWSGCVPCGWTWG